MARARPAANLGENDERLLIESAKRDPRRFAELYEHNFERVYSYVVSRMRDRSEAQDVTAEVFHQALANIEKFEWRGVPFAAWLYRIAANAMVDRAQLAAREESITQDAQDETDLEEVEQRAQIFRLVEDLPEDQSKVVRMRFVEGHSVRDIAKELGRSEGAVKQLQFRALQNLRDRLGDHHG
jgi:RNA polymerase sigma-70 factor, ECF subfamily